MMQHPSVVQDCFNHILRLKVHEPTEGAAAFAHDIHAVLAETLGTLMRQPETFGVTLADAQEVSFAVVALADESALGLGAQIAAEWQCDLLQTRLFGENRAGEQFFARLEALLPHATTRHTAILAYHTALGLGFAGRFANQRGSSAALMRVRQLTRTALLDAGALVERQLAPEALMPLASSRQSSQQVLRRFNAGLALSAALLVGAIALGALSLDGRCESLIERAELALARLGAEKGR